MLFDHCADCRRCCNVDPEEPPLQITLTAEERQTHGQLCIERTCQNLGAAGCTLGEEKPLSCKLYPLAYNPRTSDFYYDVECPLMSSYVTELRNPASEASAHFKNMRNSVRALEKHDLAFLENNFAVDADYFELRKLPHVPSVQKVFEKTERPVLPRKTGSAVSSRPAASLDRQTWTADNLWVLNEHNRIVYYTSRWDALCPYIDVTEEMLDAAPKPFLVYAVPPESLYGVPVNDSYGLVNVLGDGFWGDARRARKFNELEKQYRKFSYSETLVPGRNLTIEDILRMGGEHFDLYGIDAREVAGFADYIRGLELVILRVHAPDGDLVLTDVSMLLPERNQIYGSFCQWNRAYKNRSPGIYACLLACKWAAKNGYRYYNLGPVGDYGYKSLFVTEYEPLYGLALTDMQDPLVLDRTSPLHVDFLPQHWNQLYRAVGSLRRAGGAR